MGFCKVVRLAQIYYYSACLKEGKDNIPIGP